MALKIVVKAGIISNLSDARYCAGMGVEMLGFKIDPNANDSVSPELFNAITGWVSGPEIVGEIASSNLPDPDLYEVSCFQVSDVNLLPAIKAMGKNAILSIDLSELDYEAVGSLMNNYKEYIKYFLLMHKRSSTLSEKDMAIINEWSKRFPIMLGFGIQKENLNTILDMGVEAVSISGSNEIRPGFKSYDEMADILEELEE